jgi:hypothetical protein
VLGWQYLRFPTPPDVWAKASPLPYGMVSKRPDAISAAGPRRVRFVCTCGFEKVLTFDSYVAKVKRAVPLRPQRVLL